MAVLQIDVKDEDIKDLGEELTKDFLKRQIKLFRLIKTMNKIREKIMESGIDYEAEVKKAREEAWEEYKEEFFRK